MSQQPLFCESLYEALQAAVMGCGGYKKVGAELWPSLPVDRAGRDLSDCLNPDNARKLSLDELMSLLGRARREGIHTAAAFVMRDAGYADPVPVDPETEKERLQREFIRAAGVMEGLAKRITTLSERAA